MKKVILLREKFFLVCFGIILSLVIIELGLRLAGLAILYSDNLRNRKELSKQIDKDTVTILCLGPCFTVGIGVTPENAYPNQLERILKEHNPNKNFFVLNRGVRSKNLSFFVNNLEYLINKYQPKIVILNINDRVGFNDSNVIIALKDLISLSDKIKIYARRLPGELKIFRILKMIFSKDRIRNLAVTPIQYLTSFGRKSFYAMGIENAQENAKENPNKASNWFDLSNEYASHGLYDLAIESISKAIQLSPKEVSYYIALFWYYGFLGEYNLALNTRDKVFEIEPKKAEAIGQEITSYERSLKENWRNPQVFNLYSDLVQDYALLGEYKKAIVLMKKIIGMDPISVENYDILIFLESMLGADKNKINNKKLIDKTLYFHKSSGWGFSQDMKRLFTNKKSRINTVLLNEPEVFKRLLMYNLKRAVKITKKYRVRFLLENTGTYAEQQEIIKQVCKELYIPLADIYTSLKNQSNPELLFHDYLFARFNNEGYRFLAEEIYKALNKNGILEQVK
jgi:tetratricopeptide (TPR) repeat protein